MNARPNSEKWMWFGRQAFGWFPQGYAPGFTVMNRYRPSSSVRQRPAPEKFGIERRVVLIDVVRVAARGVRLPDLHQLPAQRLAVRVEHPSTDDDPLPERLTRVLPREVGVERADRRLPVRRPRQLASASPG